MRAGRLARLGVVPAIAAIVLVATAAPAWAHAVLEKSNPPADGVVAESPPALSLTYNENVEVSFGAIRVFTCQGARITTGAPRHAPGDDRTVLVSVPKLAPGVYIVSWHVISADSHPVSGSYSIRIGPGAPPSVGGCATETTTKSSTTVGTLFGIARAGLFAGLALLIGGAVFLVLVSAGTSAARSTRVAMWAGWALTVAATVGGLMLQGPYAAGAGLGDAVKWSVVRDVLHTKYGHVAEARLVLLFVALALLPFAATAVRGRRVAWWWAAPGALLAIGLAVTPGWAGHAATGDWTVFAVPLDTVHVLAMSIWLGGLVVLLAAALTGGLSGGLRRAITTFSRVAFWCVVALVASGIFASWRQVGFALRGYLHTSYGNILLVKVGIVVVLVALAGVSRAIVRRRQSAPLDAPDSVVAAIDQRTVVGLRRSVAGEVLLGIAVLAATALLVNAQPARSALAPTLFSGSVNAGSGASAMTIQVIVDPARVGSNEVHVYTLTTKGANLNVRDITAKFVGADGTTVQAGLARGGPNHFLANAVAIAPGGKYQMLVEVTQVIGGRAVVTAGVLDVPIR